MPPATGVASADSCFLKKEKRDEKDVRKLRTQLKTGSGG